VQRIDTFINEKSVAEMAPCRTHDKLLSNHNVTVPESLMRSTSFSCHYVISHSMHRRSIHSRMNNTESSGDRL